MPTRRATARRTLAISRRRSKTAPRPFVARTNRPGHIAFGADALGFATHDETVIGAESPNGNSVALEDQMMRAAQTKQSHDMALGVYSKSLDILRTSLGRK